MSDGVKIVAALADDETLDRMISDAERQFLRLRDESETCKQVLALLREEKWARREGV